MPEFVTPKKEIAPTGWARADFDRKKELEMGLGDLFKAKENEALRAQVAQLESMLTPEMRDSVLLQQRIEQQKQELEALRAQ